MVLKHDNVRCYFAAHPFMFTKQWLKDYKWLNTLPRCCCFQFAICHNDPDYENYEIPFDQFKKLLDCSSAWKFIKKTRFKYNLRSGLVTQDRDPFVYEALKEYDLPYYYELCDKNKSPKVGRMYYSLLQYMYPIAKRPRGRETYFWDCLRRSINFVFSQFDECEPIHWTKALYVMPHNTSAGFNGLQYSGDTTRMKKGDILPFIKLRYLENWRDIVLKDKYPDDYCMFAMRGHLSDRTKVKTRPVWLVSASTIVSELRFYQPFYDQINNKPFFKERWITGTGSMPRLNRYLRRHPNDIFYNTDISGWDSYRASWFHELVINRLGKKLKMTQSDRKEFKYCRDSAIRTKVLLPDGSVFQKLAGIISGTAGTLLINCLLNTIGGYTIMQMMKIYSLQGQWDFMNKIKDPNWLGDDFSFFSTYNIDLEKFAAMSYKYFAVIINVDKTIVAKDINDRKYLGYQLKDGFLYRPTKELFQSLLYSERPFPKEDSFSISFSRFFSYMLLGGINDYKFLEFFYYYMGKFKDVAEKVDVLFTVGMDNIFKLLKDVWNIRIHSFNIETFRKMYFGMLKYCLLYGYDLQFDDLLTFK